MEKSGDRMVMVIVFGVVRFFDGEKGSKKKVCRGYCGKSMQYGKEGCSIMEGLVVEVLEVCYFILQVDGVIDSFSCQLLECGIVEGRQ